MTRASGYALALLLGVCCLGHTSAFAQYGPSGPVPNAPGSYSVYPNGGPQPECPDPWLGSTDEVEASINRFGPRVVVDSWFLRAEYLNWNIGSPGNVPLGAPVAGVQNQAVPFTIFVPGTQIPFAYGYVPTTNSINLTDTSGVQVTAGVEFIDGGQFELSAFMLARKQSGFTLPLGLPFDLSALGFGSGIPGTGPLVPIVVATSTLQNGQIANDLFLYDKSFQAIFTSQLWGAEANYLWGETVDAFQFLPLAGARYMNLTETLTQIGVFQDPFIGGPIVSTQIGARTINNLWGGQVGFRGQMITKYLELGVTPKLLMLGNTAASSVYAARFRSINDPTVYNEDVTTKFTFGTDVNAFATVNIAPNFSVRVGYNVLWINQVTRPHRDIIYDNNGPAAPAGIGQQTVFHDIFIHGFSFGAEFRF